MSEPILGNNVEPNEEPNEETITKLDDLLEPIKVILSLGADVPATPGLTVHILTIHYYYSDAPEFDSADSWVYTSYEAGLRWASRVDIEALGSDRKCSLFLW